jgi:SAM-dependent methyltransferase
LFLELACIRWLGSTVIFLTFFTNIVLMASFLGVSVGCLAATRRASWMNATIPLMLVTAASAIGFWWVYNHFGDVVIDVGSQQSPQLIYFGTDYRVRDPAKWVVPIEFLAAFFFILVALLFIGPGQEMGRRFAAIDNRLLAYTADIAGSLTGIAAFGLMSVLWLPAWFWFLIAVALGIAFVPRRRVLHAVLGLGVLVLVGAADWPRDPLGVASDVIWSPYYQVRFRPSTLAIDVNHLAHQGMVRIDRAGPAYSLPHFLNRAAGGRPFDDVMIIGAGSGNDVAAALASGVRHVDAVEIDPVINRLGRAHHPNHPFNDPRVSIHLDDGRGFLRKTTKQYDLISYALVDSLALHSSYSSVRLESFLFTEQAFRDVKAKLKPGGVFAMYNFFRQGWVVGRLATLAEKVFGEKPIVFSMPYQARISPGTDQRYYNTFLLVGNGGSPVVDAIRTKFATERFFWMIAGTATTPATMAFGPEPPANARDPAINKIGLGPAAVDLVDGDQTPSDDWPFLYLRDPSIPALNLRGMGIVAGLSLVILVSFAPIRSARLNGQMFFLGAGFMLLETKGLVHMALLFGATWMVNSIVFSAILTMILFANLFVLATRPRRLAPFYALLLATLALNAMIPMESFLGLPGTSKFVVSCTVVFLPVFFAGVIFAMVFERSKRPDVDFGSNIAGIVLGGLSENLSLVFGFNNLLWLAIAYYALSALLAARRD